MVYTWGCRIEEGMRVLRAQMTLTGGGKVERPRSERRTKYEVLAYMHVRLAGKVFCRTKSEIQTGISAISHQQLCPQWQRIDKSLLLTGPGVLIALNEEVCLTGGIGF